MQLNCLDNKRLFQFSVTKLSELEKQKKTNIHFTSLLATTGFYTSRGVGYELFANVQMSMG